MLSLTSTSVSVDECFHALRVEVKLMQLDERARRRVDLPLARLALLEAVVDFHLVLLLEAYEATDVIRAFFEVGDIS